MARDAAAGFSAEEFDGSEDELSDASVLALPVGPKPVPNWEDDQDRGFYPDTLPRRCTDCICIPFYFVCFSVLMAFSVHEIMHSSLSTRSFTGRDYMGMPCGEDDNADKPYVYFCLNRMTADEFLVDNKRLNTLYPLCVEDCPSAWNETIECYIGNGTIAAIRTYASFAQNRICTPQTGTAGNPIFVQLIHFYLRYRPIQLAVNMFERTWEILAAFAVGFMVTAFVYTQLVSRFVSQIVWTGLALCVLGPAGFALRFWWCDNKIPGGCRSIVNPKPAFYATLAITVVLACVICRASNAINKAVVCMHWSCKCVREVPSLKMAPVLRTLWELATLDFYVYAILCVWSNTNVDALRGEMTDKIVVKKDDDLLSPVVAGLVISATVFVCLWNMVLLHQVNNVAQVYAVQTWFFQGGMRDYEMTRRPSVFYGYWIAFRYHFGTCIYAALVICVVTPVRLPLKIITNLLRDRSNPIGMCFIGCCDGLIAFYDDNLSGLSSHAIYDVVLNGYPFTEAARHCAYILSEEGHVGGILKGATWLFEIAGVGTFAFAGFYGMLAVLSYGYSDPQSERFVSVPTVLGMVAAVLAVLTSYPFTHLFRITSDAILYSRTVEKQRTPPLEGSSGGMGKNLCSADLGWLICMDSEQRMPARYETPKNAGAA
eukprot:TRINITY_DN17648_c0_g2_i1.p1 TRINITY_DN17648_c0_g2~~TRINITY_DN17648_c0_g2_i1.p1  ORF type:complete len:685 (-),score=72.21 TRINITY_DN17648_c0_g2_i1:73-2040(-)